MSDKVVEVWRPFIAEAPDMQLEVKSGNELHIPMSEYMRQGAVDIEDFSSPLNEEKDPLFANSPISKRGWLFNLAILGQAKHGVVTYDTQRRGFIYKSDSNFIGEDCFNYILTNGKQVSYTGKVNITVSENYKLILGVEQNEEGLYRFKAKVTTPEGEKPVSVVYYNWYYVGPYLEAGRVRIGKKYFTGTRIRSRGSYQFRYYIVLRKGDVWGYGTPAHETDFDSYVDSRTGQTFVPIDRYNDVEVQALVRLEGKGWGSPEDLILTARLSDFYGKPWEESGTIIDPNAPDTGETSGKSQPKYMERVSIIEDHSVQVPDVK